MKKLSLSAAATLVLLASCSSGTDSIPVIDLASNVNVADTENSDEILEVKLALNPEVTDTTLIGGISLSGISGDFFYISDDDHMMVFDKDGKCVYAFSRKGNGPGEYGQYAYARLNPATNGWAAFSLQSPKVYNYSPSGEFTGSDTLPEVSVPDYAAGRWIGRSGSQASDTITMYYYNERFELTDTVRTPLLYQIFDNNGWKIAFGPSISSYGSQATMYWNDTVYNVTDPKAGLRPEASVNLGDLRMPAEMRGRGGEESGAYIEATIHTTAGHYMAWINYDNRLFAQFYDRKSGRLIASLSCQRDPDKPYGVPFSYEGKTVYLAPAYFTTDDAFYFTASDATMSELTGDEEANPAIFSIQIK